MISIVFIINILYLSQTNDNNKANSNLQNRNDTVIKTIPNTSQLIR